MSSMSGDFDFFVGQWSVHNRRLRKRLAGATDWEEFPGASRSVRAFDGAANFDEIAFPTLGRSGLTLRTFDPARREWSLYWVSSVDGRLCPPVVGRFVDGRGEFHGDDHDDGRPVRVRFIWSGITPTAAHWEQAFSIDDGKTWETNWTMDFTRVPE